MYCPNCDQELIHARERCTACGYTFPFGAWDTDSPDTMQDASGAAALAEPLSVLGARIAGRYEVKQFCERGGMGEVFAGIDLATGRRVAIKLLAHELLRVESAAGRFLREGEAAASVRHPNVVEIRAVGTHEERPYLIMGFIDGPTVAELVRRAGRLPLTAAIRLAIDVCDGLAAIHQRGYVHRDIKSQNLMVERDGRCVILDFGILRVAGSKMTATGTLMGTPAYIAPEQACDARAADARSDLYSLGVALFEMLTGTVPFRAKSTIELIHLAATAPRPRATLVVPELPPAADALLLRALAVERAARFQNAREFREALCAL